MVSYSSIVICLYLLLTTETFCSPLSIQSGEVTYDVDKIVPGTKALFNCIKDYHKEGFAVRTCGKDGQWSGSSPVCSKTYL